MFEKEAKERAKDYTDNAKRQVAYECGFLDGADLGYNKAKAEVEDGYRESLCNSELEKANEWHNLNENSKDLPGEDEWVEGLYIWYYKDKPQWDIFKVRWVYEIGELDEKLVCWYSSDDCWHKVDEPDYWRKITLPMRNEYDRKY